jgi:hypothetical protein
MIKSGVKKVRKDHRNYSWHRTFGSISPAIFIECNFDAGFPQPNQGTDGFPYGCTGYAQTGLCQDEDKAQYFPKFTYDETLNMEGIFIGNPQFEEVGCSVTDSLKSTIVYGVQKIGETPAEALNHRRGAYYQIEETGQFDWFDSIRSCLQLNQQSISIATPWYSDFAVPINGVLTTPSSYDTTSASWHNWKCCGWKTINGVPYLIVASWQGSAYGENGFCYVSREIINTLLDINGSAAFTLASYSGQIQNVELTILETIQSYAQMLLEALTAL